MARRRASDTAAIVAPPSGEHRAVHIRTEKIDNGFLVHTSHEGHDGSYSSNTRFHQNEPKIIAKAGRGGGPPSGVCGDSSLCGATEHLKD